MAKYAIIGGIIGFVVALALAYITSLTTPTLGQQVANYLSEPAFPFYGNLQYPINPFVAALYGALIGMLAGIIKK